MCFSGCYWVNSFAKRYVVLAASFFGGGGQKTAVIAIHWIVVKIWKCTMQTGNADSFFHFEDSQSLFPACTAGNVHDRTTFNLKASSLCPICTALFSFFPDWWVVGVFAAPSMQITGDRGALLTTKAVTMWCSVLHHIPLWNQFHPMLSGNRHFNVELTN